MSTTTPESDIRPPDTGGDLRRGGEGRMLAGVCVGLGRYAGIDPVLVRVGFAVLVLGSGIGVFIYIAAFLLMRCADGSPGYVEQWTNRRFDPQTVLALLTGVLGFGLVMNLFADTTGPGTIVVGTMIAIALLAAHSRGVDLLALARSLPDRLSLRRRGQAPVGAARPPFEPGYGSPHQGVGAAGAAGATGAAEAAGAGRTDEAVPYGGPAATGPEHRVGAPEAQGPSAARAAEPATEAPQGDAPPAPSVPGPEATEPPAVRTERGPMATPPEAVPAAPEPPQAEAARAAVPGEGSEASPSEPAPSVSAPSESAPSESAPSESAPGGAAAGEAPGGPAGDVPADRPREHPPGATDQTVILPNLSGPTGATVSLPPVDAPGETGDGGPRRPGGPVWEAGSTYGSREPFAPRGPYHSSSRYAEDDPYGGLGHGHPGPVTGGLGTPAAATTRTRPRSFVGLATILVAIIVGGIMTATQPSTSAVNLPLVGGAVLITIGGGLLLAAWFGRSAGLIAAGVLVSLALIAGSTLDDLPRRVGSYTWAPASVAEARSESYQIGIGDGTLDLTGVEAEPGSRTRLEAAVAVGSLEVIVPPEARVEVHARVRVGDITVGRSTRGGTGLSLTTVLEPETAGGPTPPVFELHVKTGVGDVEVRHG